MAPRPASTTTAWARPTGLTDGSGAVSSATLNSIDRPYVTSDADLGTRNLCFDTAGRLSVVTDGKNQAQVRSYDGLNRVIQRDFYNADGSVDQSHQFVFDDDGSEEDGSEDDSSGGTNLMGHIAQVASTHAEESRNSTYALSYDAYGRVDSRRLTFDGTYTTVFEHDPLGRVSIYTYPDGSTLESSWTSIGFLAAENIGRCGRCGTSRPRVPGVQLPGTSRRDRLRHGHEGDLPILPPWQSGHPYAQRPGADPARRHLDLESTAQPVQLEFPRGRPHLRLQRNIVLW